MKRSKPNNKCPQLWISVSNKVIDANYNLGYLFRIRILYPNGTTEWCDGNVYGSRGNGTFGNYPCWQPKYKLGFKKRVKLMRKYDRKRGATTEFVCNL